MKITELKPDTKNANRGTARGNKAVEDSLRLYGGGRSILIDRNGQIIAGNKTASNAIAAGIDEVIIVPSDGTKIIAVQRTDLDLNDPKAKELAIADNRAAELGLEWDPEVLGQLATELDLKPFFTDEELNALVPVLVDPLDGADDEVPEPPVDPVTQPGDLYLLGDHRLLCGDSTVATDVDRLLDGATPHLMVTDPPYGVSYDADWRNQAERSDGNAIGGRAIGKVFNDDRADWRDAWALFSGDVAYVWHAGVHAATVAESLIACDFQIRSQIVWSKSNFAISRGHYHWQHEPCWYAVRKNGTGHWSGDRKQTTLWEIDKPQKSETGHSTQKPVECMRRPIINNSQPSDIVYDPFLG